MIKECDDNSYPANPDQVHTDYDYSPKKGPYLCTIQNNNSIADCQDNEIDALKAEQLVIVPTTFSSGPSDIP